MSEPSLATASEARFVACARAALARLGPGVLHRPLSLRLLLPAARLAIEVDGSSQAGPANAARDFERDKWHQDHDITTLRFTLATVMRDRRTVLWQIDQALKARGFRTDWRTRRRQRKEDQRGAICPQLEPVVNASDRTIEVQDQRLSVGYAGTGSADQRDDIPGT